MISKIPSFAESIDYNDIVVQLRMERQVSKGSFILLEGPGDVNRYKRHFNEADCSIIICWGEKNVLPTLESERAAGSLDLIALVDSDFDRLTGQTINLNNLFYSAWPAQSASAKPP